MKLKTFIILILIFISSPVILYIAYKQYQDYKTDLAFQKSVAPIKELYERNLQYIKETEKIRQRYEAMLKADHYGGKTPEETLKLFVDALKKKDYKLASKYYLPWKQKEAEADLKDWIENYRDGFGQFMFAYDKGIIKVNNKATKNAKFVEIYDNPDDNISYIIDMTFNNFNGIWKIEEF